MKDKMKFKELTHGDVFYEASNPENVYEYSKAFEYSHPWVDAIGSDCGLPTDSFKPDSEVVVIHNTKGQS